MRSTSASVTLSQCVLRSLLAACLVTAGGAGCAAESSEESSAADSALVVKTGSDGSSSDTRTESGMLLGLVFEGFNVFSIQRGTLGGQPVRCFYGEFNMTERGRVPLTPHWVSLATLKNDPKYRELTTAAFEKKATSTEASTMTSSEQSSLALFLTNVKAGKVPATAKACP
jgi:hypothetical protein